MADVTACRELIPEKYLASHDYEPADDAAPGSKNRFNMPNGAVPLDLAFCRWMAVEKGVCMMPVTMFQAPDSPTITDSYVRLAICMDRQKTVEAIERIKAAM